MSERANERTFIVLNALEHFPPSVRDALISDRGFRSSYDIITEAQITFGDNVGTASVGRSNLFESIRELLKDHSARPLVKSGEAEEWLVQIVERDAGYQLFLSCGERRFLLPDCATLSEDRSERIAGLDRIAAEVNLSNQARKRWREAVAAHALTDDEMALLHTEIKATLIRVAALVRAEMAAGTGQLSILVPTSSHYFDRLVGEYDDSQNIVEYAQRRVREHIRELISWNPYYGFLYSLLLSSHSSISAESLAEQMEEEKLIKAYEWLQSAGDRISQIGAIEIGLSILDKRPILEPFLQRIIEQIREDNPDDDQSQFNLLSSLTMLVDGERSRKRVVPTKPPFWRRLGSIAQASLIQRCVIDSHIDIATFSSWAAGVRVRHFYLQTLSDLRLEPRWLPDYASGSQLKAEFIGRIMNAARRNDPRIQSKVLRETLFGEGPAAITWYLRSLHPYLPGPLEGDLEASGELPAELLKAIEEQFGAEVLHTESFTALVNSSLIFRIGSQQAQLAAKALRTVKHQVRQDTHKGQLFSLLMGLASVAAVTRNGELAAELQFLTRRYRHESSMDIFADKALTIGLIAAAAHRELDDWCRFVGEWVTELAFQSLQGDEMARLHSCVQLLCQIEPELWRTCGRAEAALSSAVGN